MRARALPRPTTKRNHFNSVSTRRLVRRLTAVFYRNCIRQGNVAFALCGLILAKQLAFRYRLCKEAAATIPTTERAHPDHGEKHPFDKTPSSRPAHTGFATEGTGANGRHGGTLSRWDSAGHSTTPVLGLHRSRIPCAGTGAFAKRQWRTHSVRSSRSNRGAGQAI